MKISNLFKKDAKKKDIGSFQKMEDLQLNKVLGGAAAATSTATKPPPTGGVTHSDDWTAQ